MIKIAICDDEIIQLKYYEKFIKDFSVEKDLNIQIDSYEDGNDLIKVLDTLKYDIFILDINMPKINGYNIASTIKERNLDGLIIFLTNNEEYVFDSFKINIFRYVLKSKGNKEFNEALAVSVKSILESRERIFTIKTNGEIINLEIDNIQYFEVFGRLITAYTKWKSCVFYAKMYEIEDYLKNFGFVRVHNSFLVNVKYIHVIDKDNITLLDDTKIPISRSKRKEFKKIILKYGSWSSELDDN